MSFTWRLPYRTAVWKTRRRRRGAEERVAVSGYDKLTSVTFASSFGNVFSISSAYVLKIHELLDDHDIVESLNFAFNDKRQAKKKITL